MFLIAPGNFMGFISIQRESVGRVMKEESIGGII